MTVLLEARDLTVRYGGHTALEGVDLQLSPGEIVTVVGPNGSGKSTLLRALIGAVPLARGRIRPSPDLRIGYVPQKLQVDPTLPLTVDRFLQLPHRVPAAERSRALEEAGVPHLARRQLVSLSGGQLQRVLLARALRGRPNLLLLDEATQGLDQPGSAAFYRQLEEVRDRSGCAVVMVSHELHVVMSASDRVLCLNGHICCQGEPEAVSSAPEYRALFGSGTGGALALYRHEHDHHHEDGMPHLAHGHGARRGGREEGGRHDDPVPEPEPANATVEEETAPFPGESGR